MAVLRRKLRRDVFANTGTLLTVIVIMAVGTGSFVGFGSAQRILESSKQAYYRRYRMADFWVEVKKAPLSVVERIAGWPEIAALHSRVVFDVMLDLPGVVQPLSGRLISAPAEGLGRTINGICLMRGSGFSGRRREEVILGEAFAQARGLSPGDRIELILNRKRESFVIVGTAISPEYVYMVQGEGDLLPDPEHFGILYVEESYAREVLDFEDACNQIVGALAPQSPAGVDVLLKRLHRVLDPYGVLATTPQSRQASNRFLSDEIAGLAVTAVLMPAIFLAVAALALNILMRRLAERQRVIIGTLKALGCSNRQVLMHFLGFGVAVGTLGGVLGNCIGLGFAAGLIEVYRMFYQFPRFFFQVYPDLLIMGLLISVSFALLGTVKGVWLVLRLPPAEAMRPQPPQRGGAVLLERWPALWNALSFRTDIALRSIARHRGRTLTAIVSSTLAASIILLTLSMYDSMLFLVDFQFEKVAHSDVDIGMREERSRGALLESQALPGVDAAEAILGVVCDLRNGVYARRLAVSGLSPAHRLTTPMNAALQPIDIPPEGLVMSRKLAQLLNLQIGDPVELMPVRGRRQTVLAQLAAVVDSYLGLDCYADIRYLSRLVGESLAVNAVQLQVNPGQSAALYSAIKQLPNAQGLGVRSNTIANIEDTFVKTMLFSLGMMILFSGVIALGSTLNTTLMDIGDRFREISTLRVLGYGAGEIAGIFLRQNLVIHAMGFVVAVPFAYVMALAMVKAYDTELYRMPMVFHVSIIVITAVVSLVFLLIAQAVVYRHISTLEWQEGIKTKE